MSIEVNFSYHLNVYVKVMQQQTWGEMVDFIPAYSAVHLGMVEWKSN